MGTGDEGALSRRKDRGRPRRVVVGDVGQDPDIQSARPPLASRRTPPMQRPLRLVSAVQRASAGRRLAPGRGARPPPPQRLRTPVRNASPSARWRRRLRRVRLSVPSGRPTAGGSSLRAHVSPPTSIGAKGAVDQAAEGDHPPSIRACWITSFPAFQATRRPHARGRDHPLSPCASRSIRFTASFMSNGFTR